MKNIKYDLQDPTVPASAPQQQYGAMLSGFTIVAVQAANEEAAKLAIEDYFRLKAQYGRLQAWLEAGSRVALVAERTPEERWSA